MVIYVIGHIWAHIYVCAKTCFSVHMVTTYEIWGGCDFLHLSMCFHTIRITCNETCYIWKQHPSSPDFIFRYKSYYFLRESWETKIILSAVKQGNGSHGVFESYLRFQLLSCLSFKLGTSYWIIVGFIFKPKKNTSKSQLRNPPHIYFLKNIYHCIVAVRVTLLKQSINVDVKRNYPHSPDLCGMSPWSLLSHWLYS